MIGRFFERVRLWLGEHAFALGITAFVLLFLVIYLSSNIFIFLETGQAGVLYRRFAGGTQVNRVYGEGLHIIFPWDKMTAYNVQLQQQEHTFSVLSSNGLTVAVTVSIRFRPKVELLGVLHKEVGPDYASKIVIPAVQALVRNVFGQYTPEELYTSKRAVVQQILQGSLDEVGEKYVLLDDLLVETIGLPPTIQTAIEEKLTEEQRVLEMKYRVDREKLETNRRVIEAQGINDANRILASSLDEQVLRFKGIDATLELSKSANSKVVVMGDRNGLPLIYDSLLMGSPTFAGTNGVHATNSAGHGNASSSNAPPAEAAKPSKP